MKIEIERSGGFAGIIKKITMDTENLPKDMAKDIEKNISKTKLTNRLSNASKRRVLTVITIKFLLVKESIFRKLNLANLILTMNSEQSLIPYSRNIKTIKLTDGNGRTIEGIRS